MTVPHTVLEQIIARILKYITEYNDSIPMQPATLTRFHSRAAPAISIADYLKRIIQFASVEKACLLILLVYIDRVCARQRVFTLSSLTVHRFIIAAITGSLHYVVNPFIDVFSKCEGAL